MTKIIDNKIFYIDDKNYIVFSQIEEIRSSLSYELNAMAVSSVQFLHKKLLNNKFPFMTKVKN